MTLAVLGAGIAGLSAASELQENGHSVTVFEKSRGVGGRTATRRMGDFRFDHGAQYFTARDDAFSGQVEQWLRDGVVKVWNGRVGAWDGKEIEPTGGSQVRYVGVPGMNAMAKDLASTLDVRVGQRVNKATPCEGGWELEGDDGASLGYFSALISSLPPAQADELLGDHTELRPSLAQASMQPCWATMALLPRAVISPFDGLFVNEGPLRWVARNNSKPGRPDTETWILHASEAWSTQMLQRDAEEIGPLLWTAFQELWPSPCEPADELISHRWQYSVAGASPQKTCLVDRDLSLVLCGDWCLGARIEGAWLSGMGAAEAFCSQLRAGARE